MATGTRYQMERDRSDEVQIRWDNSVGWHPKRSAWGLLSFAEGSGVGGISWFATREEMLLHIEEVMPFNPGGGDNDPFVVAEVCRAITTNMRYGFFDDLTGIRRLNVALKNNLDIRWIMTLEDLCSGDTADAKEVRAWYHERMDDEADDFTPEDFSLIEIDETDTFTDDLCEYGL